MLNGGQREDAEEPGRYLPNERPCPTCRGPISPDKIFSRHIFEPSDDELQTHVKSESVDVDAEVVMVDVEARVNNPGKVVRKRKTHARRVLDSDDDEEDNDDDDLSDFIVQDDQDEDEKDARRELKKRLKGKRKEIIVIEDSEDDGVIFGARPDTPTGPVPIKLMSKFLPSTKMKVRMLFIVGVIR